MTLTLNMYNQVKLMSRYPNWHFPILDLDAMTLILKLDLGVDHTKNGNFGVNSFKTDTQTLRKHYLPGYLVGNDVPF